MESNTQDKGLGYLLVRLDSHFCIAFLGGTWVPVGCISHFVLVLSVVA